MSGKTEVVKVGPVSLRLGRLARELVCAIAERNGGLVTVPELLPRLYGARVASAFFGTDDWGNLRALIHKTNLRFKEAGLGRAILCDAGAGYRWSPSVNIPTGCASISCGRVTEVNCGVGVMHIDGTARSIEGAC